MFTMFGREGMSQVVGLLATKAEELPSGGTDTMTKQRPVLGSGMGSSRLM